MTQNREKQYGQGGRLVRPPLSAAKAESGMYVKDGGAGRRTFSLDVQAIFAVRGFNPQKKIAIWAVDHTPM